MRVQRIRAAETATSVAGVMQHEEPEREFIEAKAFVLNRLGVAACRF